MSKSRIKAYMKNLSEKRNVNEKNLNQELGSLILIIINYI